MGISVRGAKYPQYSGKDKRLESFINWPVALKQRPQQLSDAGFYYHGVGDNTVCFYCGGGIKNWEESENPWNEHAKWYKDCEYLNLSKGEQFVASVQASFNASSSGPTSKCEDETLFKEDTQDERLICKICLDNEMSVVLEPCGHTFCADCALSLRNCGMCRSQIKKRIKLYY